MSKFASPVTLAKNMQNATWVRIFLNVIGGAVAGICGFTGAQGIICFVAMSLLTSSVLLSLMKFTPSEYLGPNAGGPLGYMVSGLMDNVIVYIVFWSLFYALVHFYG